MSCTARLRLCFLPLLFAIVLCCVTACKEPAETAVPALIKELSARESGRRNKAALALAAYGSDAKPAVRALAQRLSDPNGGVRSSAAYALRSIGTPEAQSALDSYEKDK